MVATVSMFEKLAVPSFDIMDWKFYRNSEVELPSTVLHGWGVSVRDGIAPDQVPNTGAAAAVAQEANHKEDTYQSRQRGWHLSYH